MCVRVKFGMFLLASCTFIFSVHWQEFFLLFFYSLALFAAYVDEDAQETTDSACVWVCVCGRKVAATVESIYFSLALRVLCTYVIAIWPYIFSAANLTKNFNETKSPKTNMTRHQCLIMLTHVGCRWKLEQMKIPLLSLLLGTKRMRKKMLQRVECKQNSTMDHQMLREQYAYIARCGNQMVSNDLMFNQNFLFHFRFVFIDIQDCAFRFDGLSLSPLNWVSWLQIWK